MSLLAGFLQGAAAGRCAGGNGISPQEHLLGAGAGGIAQAGIRPGLHQQAYVLLLEVHAGQHERRETGCVASIDHGSPGQKSLHGGRIVAFHGGVQGILWCGAAR